MSEKTACLLGCRWSENSKGTDDWVSRQGRGRGTWSLSENVTDIAQDYDATKEGLMSALPFTLMYAIPSSLASRDLSEY